MLICLEKQKKDAYLPSLFNLFYENMHTVAPSGLTYDQEKALWLAEVSPAMDKPARQVVMVWMDDVLAGYVQYYIREKMLMIEELQIKKEYQKTLLFHRLCKHLLSVVPKDLQTIEAYAHKQNENSIHMMQKLGMEVCDPDPDSPFVHMKGVVGKIRTFLKK